jgi:hypothetical protein
MVSGSLAADLTVEQVAIEELLFGYTLVLNPVSLVVG